MRLVLSTLAAMTLAGLALPAHAALRGLAVSAQACPDLNQAEVERLLGIELAEVVSFREGEPLRIELDCDARVLHIVASDPVTHKRLSRDVDLDAPELGRDRTVALLISQLFLSSWSVLLAERTTPAKLEVLPTRRAPPAARRALRLGVSLAAGPRVRSLVTPVIGAWIGLRPWLFLQQRSYVYLDLGYERASLSRSLGSIGIVVADASLGLGFRSSRHATVALDLGASLGAAYIDAQGHGSGSAIGHHLRGAAVQTALEVGPTILLQPLRVGVLGMAGVTFPSATALVAGDTERVSLAGVWLGAAVIVSLGRT